MSTGDEATRRERRLNALYTAALANAVLWVMSIIALIFVVRRCPSAKGLFVVLAGGLAVASAVILVVRKER